MPLLGFLESLGGFRGLVTTLIQPLGGWLADRLGRKLFVILASALAMASLAIYLLAGITRNWLLLIPGVFLLGMVAISRPAMNTLTAESTGSGERGAAYSTIMFSFALPGAFTPLLAGFVADRLGFLNVFLIGLALEMVVLGLVTFGLRETLALPKRKPLLTNQLAGVVKGVLIPARRLRGFYTAVTVDAFAWGTGSSILYGLLSETYHFTAFQLGVMSSLSAASWAVSQLPIGRMVDRHGATKFLMLSEVFGILMMAGWLTSTRFEAFAALQLLYGLAIATWAPAMLTWIANSVSEEERAEEMGRVQAFRGLLSFPAPYIGGVLYEALGFRGPILVNLLGALVALILIAVLVREPTGS
jgi:MFS family permease